ncbi:tetraspanin-2-like [Macadamia integrifolia]|uniref:tetraspanin-2-like n=1 Tax=Macadamia integrifolia TaxID=60698 RepID=UPI001C4E9016|nr:tetraspanin-2-like [Macadamia integrifolia]
MAEVSQMSILCGEVPGLLADQLQLHWVPIRLFSYFLMKLVLTLVFIIFVIASWNVGEGNWGHMKDCLQKVEFCQDGQVSSSKMLNPIFIACCKKPASCNSSSADENSSFYNPSCHLWSTNSTILCYDCQLCRDAVLDDFRLLPFWGFSYRGSCII